MARARLSPETVARIAKSLGVSTPAAEIELREAGYLVEPQPRELRQSPAQDLPSIPLDIRDAFDRAGRSFAKYRPFAPRSGSEFAYASPLSDVSVGDMASFVVEAIPGAGIFSGLSDAEAGRFGTSALNIGSEFLGPIGDAMRYGLPAVAGMVGGMRPLDELPMGEASRLSRAKALGADMEPWYHGSGSDISEIDPEKFGGATGTPASREAFFLTRSPEDAGMFAENAGGSPNILPMLAFPERGKVQKVSWPDDVGDTPIRSQNGQRILSGILQDAKDAGLGMVLITGAGDSLKSGSAADVLAVLDPNRIKSLWARFGPDALSHPGILGSYGGALLVTPALLSSDGNDPGLSS